MKPYYSDDRAAVLHGDCLELMAAMPDASFDAIVTDPPYGLGFMGKAWDALPPGIEWAAECLRILKPGGHLLAFGGSRTWHRLACAVEDAGFEIRDSIAWLYGSGFPKSLDVSKAIDKAAGAERKVTGFDPRRFRDDSAHAYEAYDAGTRSGRVDYAKKSQITAPATPDAQTWQGWGTALKPAFEPVVMARKPIVGTVAANVLAFGTGALNVDGCRVGAGERVNPPSGAPGANAYRLTGGDGRDAENARRYAEASKALPPTVVAGRWPANVVLDESQAEALDQQSGTLTSGANPTRRGADKFRDSYGDFKGQAECTPARGTDKGGASRFFYVAKAPQSERPKVNGIAHPTVKPLTLMQWLIRLVTPPGGHILDPFAGSGTTVEAALRERVRITAIEREADYLPLILHRIERHEDAPEPEPSLFDLEQPA